jgi:hypothetical protein
MKKGRPSVANKAVPPAGEYKQTWLNNITGSKGPSGPGRPMGTTGKVCAPLRGPGGKYAIKRAPSPASTRGASSRTAANSSEASGSAALVSLELIEVEVDSSDFDEPVTKKPRSWRETDANRQFHASWLLEYPNFSPVKGEDGAGNTTCKNVQCMTSSEHKEYSVYLRPKLSTMSDHNKTDAHKKVVKALEDKRIKVRLAFMLM